MTHHVTLTDPSLLDPFLIKVRKILESAIRSGQPQENLTSFEDPLTPRSCWPIRRFPGSWPVEKVLCFHVAGDRRQDWNFSWKRILESDRVAGTTHRTRALLMHALVAILTLQVQTAERGFGTFAPPSDPTQRLPVLSLVAERVLGLQGGDQQFYCGILCWRIWVVVHDAALDLDAELDALLRSNDAARRQRLKRKLEGRFLQLKPGCDPADEARDPRNYLSLSSPAEWQRRVAEPLLLRPGRAGFSHSTRHGDDGRAVPDEFRLSTILSPAAAFAALPATPEEWGEAFGVTPTDWEYAGSAQLRVDEYVGDDGRVTFPLPFAAAWYPPSEFTFPRLFPERFD